MRKLFATILLLAALVAANSTHAGGAVTTALNGGTNNIAQNSTNDYGSTVMLDSPSRSRLVTVQPSLKLVGAGTTAIPFVIENSVDGSPGSYSPASTNSVTPNGTNTAYGPPVVIDTGGSVYWRVRSAVNSTNNTAATNVTFKWSAKPGI